MYKEALRNPFARSDENQMYQFFKSQLQGESAHHEHMNWFNPLGDGRGAARHVFMSDFETYQLRFPSTKGEVVGKIHALVDAYCNIEDASIDRMSRLIKPALSPQPNNEEGMKLNTGFTLMMKSLSEAYSTTSRKELAYLQALKLHAGSGEEKTLRDKIYGRFMKKHATGIQETFLSYFSIKAK